MMMKQAYNHNWEQAVKIWKRLDPDLDLIIVWHEYRFVANTKSVTWVMLIPLLTIYQNLEFKFITLFILKFGFIPVSVYPQKTKLVLPRKSRIFSKA